MKTKICTKCKKELEFKEFAKGNDKYDLFFWCRKCCSIYNKNNKKRIYKRKQKYYLKNKEKINSNCLEYYELHKDKILEQFKKYRETHKDERRKYLREHKKEIRKYVNNKRKVNINFRLSECLRQRIYKSLKGINKSKHSLELIGCSLEQLKLHLEQQFTKGMNWSNYGYRGWHVDHIRPCASFNLSKPEEQAKCFHYTNLQPLWAIDNIRKQDK